MMQDRLDTINLHDEDTVYDSSDPYSTGAVKVHSSRRKWFILGFIIAGIVACGVLIGVVATKSNGTNAGNIAIGEGTDPSAPTAGSAPSPSTPQNAPSLPSGYDIVDMNTKVPTHSTGKTQAPTSTIYAYIKSVAPDGGFAIDFFPKSYQSKAFQWLENSCNDMLCESELRIRQRYALACIYFATNSVATAYTDFEIGVNEPIPDWFDASGWIVNDDECTWYGITCHKDGSVEKIDLHDNLLTGKFPAETALLKDSLKHLDIESNLVYNADEEVEWLGDLTNLVTLNIAQTPFEYDGIPTVFGKLKKLVHLDCSYTLFFGELKPEVFQDLQEVQYLYIGGNSYNSSIPSTIGDMENLLYLYAEYADLEGDLSFIKTMPKIFELWIDRNPKMKGPIPSEIGNLITLESVSLTNCGLTGPIPDEIGNLYRMQQMWLFANELQGGIPTSIGNLTRMKRFEVEQNMLQGDMPAQVCNLSLQNGGVLEILEADCDDSITNCPCCTCCGPQCAMEAPKSTQNGNKVPGNERQRRLHFVEEQRRRRRRLLQAESEESK